MPSIPLPFVVSLFLVVLLVRLLAQRERNLRPAIWFIAACTTTSTITGLRWSFDFEFAKLLQAVAGCLLPFIAWLCFSTLRQQRSRLSPYLIVTAAMVGITLLAGGLAGDLVLAAVYLGVGVALIRMASYGPDGFGAARLTDATKAQASVLVAGVMLITSGIFDVLIGLDFQFYRGSHVIGIIAVGDMLFLPLIAYAVAVAGGSIAAAPGEQSAQENAPQKDQILVAEDPTVLAAFDALMRDKKMYRDPDLTLNRLSRRLGISARQISGAINRLHGRNVSQAVNAYRIDEAKRLLSETDRSVSEIMLESGFQTKSNFNREFLRVTGISPTAFRLSLQVDVSEPRPESET
jgi:AraC-like DNA-binding protein